MAMTRTKIVVPEARPAHANRTCGAKRKSFVDALLSCPKFDLNTERFIVSMNRDPEDYTAWRERQPDFEGPIEELGAKIMAFSKRHSAMAHV